MDSFNGLLKAVMNHTDTCILVCDSETQEILYVTDTIKEFNPETDLLAKIHFQEGPIKENGVNGVANEDLLVMVIRRLQGFQDSPYSCRENAMAITKLEEALLWLRKRTMGRENRGVEGTNAV